MKRAIAGCALGVAALCLTACNDGKENATATISKAEGEILPRSVTDEMLPYGSLRSHPPFANPEDGETSGRTGNRAGVGGSASDEATGSRPSDSSAPAEDQPEPMPGAE